MEVQVFKTSTAKQMCTVPELGTKFNAAIIEDMILPVTVGDCMDVIVKETLVLFDWKTKVYHVQLAVDPTKPNEIYLSGVYINKKLRGRGHGTRILEAILDHADKIGVNVRLIAQPPKLTTKYQEIYRDSKKEGANMRMLYMRAHAATQAHRYELDRLQEWYYDLGFDYQEDGTMLYETK